MPIRPEGFRPEIELGDQEITIFATQDFLEVERILRKVTLLGEKGFHPYRQSLITLEEVPLDKLYPCALYVLKPQLELIGKLREKFLREGIDILNLKPDKTRIEYNWGNRPTCIAPPLVEVSEDDEGKMVIVDGEHRIINAKKLGLDTIEVIKVENTKAPLPAFPVSWDEVKSYDAVPPMEEKRRFRFESAEESYRWYRDLSILMK